PSDGEQQRLTKLVTQRDETPRRDLPKPGKRDIKDLPQEVQAEILDVARRTPVQQAPGDNSNTQFATLALWTARRRGMPTEPALARVEARFRGSQNADGGWSYDLHGPISHGQSSATMTAAGLMCVAVADATANDLADKEKPARDVGQDKNLRAGLAVL